MTMTMPKNKTCPIKVFFLWMFEIVGSCGHELLLPELLQLLNRPDLEGFSAGVKISDECSIKGSRINRLGVFFWIHISQIYTDITVTYIKTSKLMLALESCVFHSFSSHVVPMETNESPPWLCAKATATSSSCFVTVTILYFVDAHDFYGWFVLEWRWFVQDALL